MLKKILLHNLFVRNSNWLVLTTPPFFPVYSYTNCLNFPGIDVKFTRNWMYRSSFNPLLKIGTTFLLPQSLMSSLFLQAFSNVIGSDSEITAANFFRALGGHYLPLGIWSSWVFLCCFFAYHGQELPWVSLLFYLKSSTVSFLENGSKTGIEQLGFFSATL